MDRPVTALAGPESAVEHLRNALMLLNQYEPINGVDVQMTLKHVQAVRRRVAAALALLEAQP